MLYVGDKQLKLFFPSSKVGIRILNNNLRELKAKYLMKKYKYSNCKSTDVNCMQNIDMKYDFLKEWRNHISYLYWRWNIEGDNCCHIHYLSHINLSSFRFSNFLHLNTKNVVFLPSRISQESSEDVFFIYIFYSYLSPAEYIYISIIFLQNIIIEIEDVLLDSYHLANCMISIFHSCYLIYTEKKDKWKTFCILKCKKSLKGIWNKFC